jgi:hypothetical protein
MACPQTIAAERRRWIPGRGGSHAGTARPHVLRRCDMTPAESRRGSFGPRDKDGYGTSEQPG